MAKQTSHFFSWFSKAASYFACVLLGYIFHRLKDIIWQYPWKAIAIIHIYFSRYFNTTNNFTTNKLLTVVSKTFIWKYSSKTLKKLYEYRRNFSNASQYHEDYYAGLTDRNQSSDLLRKSTNWFLYVGSLKQLLRNCKKEWAGKVLFIKTKTECIGL